MEVGVAAGTIGVAAFMAGTEVVSMVGMVEGMAAIKIRVAS